jgi:hypothetical protein
MIILDVSGRAAVFVNFRTKAERVGFAEFSYERSWGISDFLEDARSHLLLISG